MNDVLLYSRTRTIDVPSRNGRIAGHLFRSSYCLLRLTLHLSSHIYVFNLNGHLNGGELCVIQHQQIGVCFTFSLSLNVWHHNCMICHHTLWSETEGISHPALHSHPLSAIIPYVQYDTRHMCQPQYTATILSVITSYDPRRGCWTQSWQDDSCQLARFGCPTSKSSNLIHMYRRVEVLPFLF
jgi:hypothetical protein